MKRCVTCHETRPVDDFNLRRSSADGRQARCRQCSRDWYLQNSIRHREAVARRNKRVLADNRRRLADYFAVHPCVDCGERDLRVLDFDHGDGVDKRDDVARMVGAALSWRTIEVEIAKCQVRCANCHRRRTVASGGWWRQGFHEEAERQLRVHSADRLMKLFATPR